jgi:hypothetical protein
MIKFVDEVPGDNHRRYDWKNITAQLKAKPGDWAIIEAEGAKGTNSAAQATSRNIRNGRIKGIKAGEFDAVTRGSVVYARYIGKKND